MMRQIGWSGISFCVFLCAAGTVVTASGCSPDASSELGRHDGGATASSVSQATTSDRAIQTIAALRAIPAFANSFPADRELQRTPSGFRLSKSPRGGWRSTGTPLDVTLPARSSSPLRFALSGGKGSWVEINETGAKEVSSEVVHGAVVLRDVGEDLDVVHVAEPGRAEEIRLLRSARASATAHYSMRLGPGFGLVRARGGRFEILDRSGAVRLVTAPVFAVDARGTRREATLLAEEAGSEWNLTASIDAHGLVYPVAVDPAWTASAAMVVGQEIASAVRLADGRVLLAGGDTPTETATKTAQIYDPSTNTWSAVQSLKLNRRGQRGTLLQDGRVLISGGGDDVTTFVYPAQGELYDPSTGQWTLTNPSLFGGRLWHTAALLQDGRALVASGWAGGMVGTAETYDPTTGNWAAADVLAMARNNAEAVLLGSGKVLVVGGTDYAGTALTSAELYDPGTNKWTSAGDMSVPRAGGTGPSMGVALLPSGKVLVAGGHNPSPFTTYAAVDVYDPVANSWATLQPMSRPRGYVAFFLAPLPSGRILAAGGYSDLLGYSLTAEIYDPSTNIWSSTDSMLKIHNAGMSAVLQDGSVLVAGGGADPTGTYCELFSLHPNGDPCQNPGECASEHCIDGVCCDTGCTAQCEACNNVGTVGTCGPQAGAPIGGRPACTTDGTACGGYCDGTSVTCTYPDASTACRLASCTSGTETFGASCNGAGTCPAITQSCGTYVCQGSACGTSCTSDSDCASTAYCDAVTGCTTKKTLGKACGGKN